MSYPANRSYGIRPFWISTTTPVRVTLHTRLRLSSMKPLPSLTLIWPVLSTQSDHYRCTFISRFAISFVTTVVVTR
ncbi:Uncharacterised protein [Vibrio cholerae]|nr:Uncharacterised protein [Vibrio cholerae]CSI57661.1 Uncharacterised protein [Vibrio cholerae]